MNLGATSWMALTKDSYVEIIGFIINNVIHTGRRGLMFAKEVDVDGIVTKDMARLMSAMDLGYKWDELAKCPTILIWDKGEMYFPDNEGQS